MTFSGNPLFARGEMTKNMGLTPFRAIFSTLFWHRQVAGTLVITGFTAA
jgi:hypothetical protein